MYACVQVFKEWNKGELDSFLIEITANIMAYKDTDGTPLVEKILDSAGQKGTGKWTAISALDQGMPLTLIGEVLCVVMYDVDYLWVYVCVCVCMCAYVCVCVCVRGMLQVRLSLLAVCRP